MAPAETTTVRRPFEAWSIAIPATFEETFVQEHGYWHAYDESRSVSLTSIELTHEHGPVRLELILDQAEQVLPSGGVPLGDSPPGLAGRAVEADATPPARASRCVSGVLATDGRVLLATITADDLDWARDTWLSIRAHAAPIPQSEGRAPERQPIQ